MRRTSGRSAVVLLAVSSFSVSCGQVPGGGDESGFVPGTRVHVMPMRNSAEVVDRATISGNVKYYDGRVISNAQVVQVLYGSGSYLSQVTSTASPSMATFYQGVLNSPWLDWMNEYNTTVSGGTQQSIGRGSFLKQVQITPSAANSGSTIDDTNIQAELAAQIQAGTLPAQTFDSGGNPNTLYMVNFPHGMTITQGGSSSCQAFCAYHGTFTLNGKSVYYGVLPDFGTGSGCDTGCGSSSNEFQNLTTTASHETAESITDAEVGLATTYGPPLGWYDQTNGEVGDICESLPASSVVGGDGVTYAVQEIWSQQSRACITTKSTTTTNDFSVSLSASSLSVTQGSNGALTVHSAVTSGSAQTVAFTTSGLPSGASATLSPTSVTAGSSATLTISAGTAAAGSYTVTVKGTGTSTSHTATLTLVVSAPVTNGFSLSVSPTSLSVAQARSGTATVSTAVTSGTAQTVSLSVSGVPSGATATFSSTSMTAGGSSTLTFNAGAAAAGSYTLTVTGTAASGSKTATLPITVTASTTTNAFSIAASPMTLSVVQGASGSVAISTAITSGSAQTVKLTATGVPTGATATFAATSVTAGAGTTLTIAAGTAAAGSYTITITGTGTSTTQTAKVTLTITPSVTTSGAIVNGGFETGTLSGWTSTGTTAAITPGHSGSYAARVGATGPSTDSSLSQTLTLPPNAYTLGFYYQVVCDDTIRYDWASATLKDNTTGTSYSLLEKTCTMNGAWKQALVSVTSMAGHSVTITLSNHDDNYPGDPTYTLYDDVVLATH